MALGLTPLNHISAEYKLALETEIAQHEALFPTLCTKAKIAVNSGNPFKGGYSTKIQDNAGAFLGSDQIKYKTLLKTVKESIKAGLKVPADKNIVKLRDFMRGYDNKFKTIIIPMVALAIVALNTYFATRTAQQQKEA